MPNVGFHHTDKGTWKYPWDKMTDIGDYFDVPKNSPLLTKVTTSMRGQSKYSQKVYRAYRLRSGTLRVILIAFENE